MGDFNAVVSPNLDRLSKENDKLYTSSHKPEIPLFDFFEDWAYTDLQATWQGDKRTFTWKNSLSESRIDQIWFSPNIITNIHSFNNTTIDHITGSDHSILSCEIFSDGIFNLQSNATLRRKGSRTIFDYKSMTTEEWKNFATILDHKLQTHNILELIKQEITHISNNNFSDNIISYQFKLSDIWSQIESYFIQVANRHIPTKQVKRSITVNNIHLDRSHTFKTWKSLASLITLISKFNVPPSNIIDINKQIKKINNNSMGTIHFLNHNTVISEWLPLAKEFLESLKVKLRLEETAKTRRFINKAIKSRCSDLLSNQ